MRVWLMLFMGLFGASSGYADVISVRADPYCPYNCEPGSEKMGYMIDIAKAVFERAGHKIDYQSLNWARAVEETRQGKFMAIVGGLKTDAPDFVYPDVAVGSSQSCFFTKADSKWTYEGVKSLESMKLGVVKSYSFGDTLDPYIKANARNPKRIDYVSGDTALDLNIKKLLSNRIGVVLDDSAVIGYELKGRGLTDGVKVAGCDQAKEIFMAFSPQHPKAKEYAALLTSGIAKLRASGELNTIMARYGLKDWK
ncbi:MAG TPA: transporter substrate-binding domain-containing protein [Oligoflexus sp.]|uniref:substrate-binding periplasmic protein n=1 Tax=Oligoflexus sp. TaxID=1971216 RepID=UPI002D28B91E|nr:transporter substrate-binding domain-containing protein [Oligoflexus sp.]HYX39072.1 transporter substrate-binding domain-containing protein [Oligoflexus sp.]